MTRQIKNIIAITAFLICIGLINFAGQNIDIQIRGINAFTFILIVAVLLQIIFFIPSFLLKTEKYYDLVGSLTYVTTVSLAYFAVENKTMIDSIIYFYVMIWASRLGIYLFRRVRNDGKDVRFEKAKRHFFWFLQYWMGQALWVTLTACAAIIAILSPEDDTLPVLAIFGMHCGSQDLPLNLFLIIKNEYLEKKIILAKPLFIQDCGQDQGIPIILAR